MPSQTPTKLSQSTIEKARAISDAIQSHLLETGERDATPAALTPMLVEKGLFNKEYERPGLPLRNFLRELDEAEQLSLMPQVSEQYRGKRRYWLFNPIQGDTGDNSVIRQLLQSQVEEVLRQRGVVIWLDREGHYKEFVDGLAYRRRQGKFFAPVVSFRGSFLQTLFDMEPYLGGLDPEPLLIHVPGHTDQTIRTTPLLEAYKAGRRFERSLDTLVREAAAGQASPEATEEFLQSTELTLERAENWLSEQGGEVSGFDSLKPEWVLEKMLSGEMQSEVETPAKLQALREYLARHTGFSGEFEEFLVKELSTRLHQLTEAIVGWVLCVEYVHDLTRSPELNVLAGIKNLSPPLKKTSLRLCERLRQNHAEDYRGFAERVEVEILSELNAGDPENLGKIDTFSREDSRLLEASLEALASQEWNKALRWASSRLDGPSVWLNHEKDRRDEWQLVQTAAYLGQAIVAEGRPLQKVEDLTTAIDVYTGKGKEPRDDGAQRVDRAHRAFEQECVLLLNTKLAHFHQLHRTADQLRGHYRKWVDQLSRDFARVCATSGFLPESRFQQRTLYEQEVHPRTQGSSKVAFFLVDALRYEMACELANSLEDKGAQVHLKPRLAELPSITAVGMNVLAPVCQDGKLTVKGNFEGFRVGEYTVTSNQYRLRAMGERSLERHPNSRRTPENFRLQDLLQTTPAKLKTRVKDAALVVVHSREIDESGEADVGLTAFDRWIGQLRSAVLHLQAAGVEEFVVTADHGFLLLDKSSGSVDYHGGEKVDRRWVLTDDYVSHDDMDTVALETLGYQGRSGHLMFLRDSAVFKTKGQSASTFVHGGNSLQERVIPVLHVSYAKRTDMNFNRYRLKADILNPVMGCSRVKVALQRIDDGQGFLDFAEGETVTVSFRVVDQPGEVQIQDAPGAKVVNQQLVLEENKEVEVLFTVQGHSDGKASIELFHPDGTREVEPCRPAVFFPVSAKPGVAKPSPSEEVTTSTSWIDNLPKEVKDVFLHIEQHDHITEAELIVKLGNPRKARRFANNFKDYLQLLPFHIRLEAGASGKTYFKVES